MIDGDSDPRSEIVRRFEARRTAYERAHRRTEWLGNIRLALVGLAVVLVLLPLFTRGGTPWVLLIPLALVFIVLGRTQDRAFSARRRLGAAVRFYEDSLARMEERWRALEPDGSELGPPHASYAEDLDVFGPASLFQLLCRAGTAEGRRALGGWLQVRADPATIAARQAAAVELAANLDAREALATSAGNESRSAVAAAPLLDWAEKAPPLPLARGLAVAGVLGPAALAATGSVWLLQGIKLPFVVAVAVQVAVLLATRRLTGPRADVISGPERVLSRWADLIRAVEQGRFTAPALRDIQGRLAVEGRPASDQIARLERIVNLLDARLNVFFALTLGPALMWELNLVLRAESWRRQTGPRLRDWFRAVGELEALASFAALAYERPDYIFPEIVETPGRFTATALAHPLIERTQVVPNDLELGGPGSVLLLSGSNMSGKSTLLRSVGLAAVMAQAGAPVAAERLTLSPLRLATSVRVVDSLARGTSHFYAELERLKHIFDEAQTEEPSLLYLLDEMLHGTNSRERYIGAVSVIHWLATTGAMGVVTTHDLALSQVADELPPGKAVNRHFADDVVDGEIRFDYRLRDGKVKSTNALRLMRVVGIDVDFSDAETRYGSRRGES